MRSFAYFLMVASAALGCLAAVTLAKALGVNVFL